MKENELFSFIEMALAALIAPDNIFVGFGHVGGGGPGRLATESTPLCK
jgi:hypothetical protein